MDNNMNLYERLKEAEKVAKANAQAEEKEKTQQKAKHDEFISRIDPAAEALKRFIEGSEGQALISLLRQIGQSIPLAKYNPKLTGLARFLPSFIVGTDHTVDFCLSGDGLLVQHSSMQSTGNDWAKSIDKIQIAIWSDYVNICNLRALKGEDPFCVIEEIKAEASKLTDSLLGSNTK